MDRSLRGWTASVNGLEQGGRFIVGAGSLLGQVLCWGRFFAGAGSLSGQLRRGKEE